MPEELTKTGEEGELKQVYLYLPVAAAAAFAAAAATTVSTAARHVF